MPDEIPSPHRPNTAKKVLLIDDSRMLPSATRIDKTFAGGIRSLAQDGPWDLLLIDHDLGDPDPAHTGYDILSWLEANPQYAPKQVQIITANPVGRLRMQQVLAHLYPEEANVLEAIVTMPNSGEDVEMFRGNASLPVWDGTLAQ